MPDVLFFQGDPEAVRLIGERGGATPDVTFVSEPAGTEQTLTFAEWAADGYPEEIPA